MQHLEEMDKEGSNADGRGGGSSAALLRRACWCVGQVYRPGAGCWQYKQCCEVVVVQCSSQAEGTSSNKML